MPAESTDLRTQVQAILTTWLHNHKSMTRVRHKIGNQLTIRNQPALQTTEFGRNKLLGRETVWLDIRLTSTSALVRLARISEMPDKSLDFEILPAFDEHKSVIGNNLKQMQRLASRK